MCDENKKTETTRARHSRRDTTIRDRCGPIVERMFEAFSEIAEGASNNESAPAGTAKRVPPCASMMERMASRCCGRDRVEKGHQQAGEPSS